MFPPRLILASTSPYRRAQLERLGLDFESVAPHVDEDSLQTSGLAPAEIARELALLKARAVFDKHPAATVIGGDQVCALGERILRKPGSASGARAQLAELSGKTHLLHTAVAVLSPRGSACHIEPARLAMRQLTDEEIAAYVDLDDPHDCAGSYKLEAAGIRLFERIDCADWTAIEGTPLLALCKLLREHF